MILLADSGATKTDWCIANTSSGYTIIQTEGINPFHQPESHIRSIIENQLLSSLPCSTRDIQAIFFYGAGCIPSQKGSINNALQNNFPQATFSVESDLLGAARALCKHREGIACILGTGSNSCLYDGERIVRNISPLGYILGDEGSGAYLGKRFLGDCLKGLLPDRISNEMLDELQLTAADILEKVYRQPQANRFLAGIVPCIHKHKAIPEIHSFLTDCFSDFIRRNVLPYQASLPVSFTGSVAWFFQEEIKETLASLNLTTGIFVKNPIKELVDYHLRICR